MLGGTKLSEEDLIWFDACKPVSVEDGELVVDTDNPIKQEVIAQRFLRRLDDSAALTGEIRSVRLRGGSPAGDGDARPDPHARRGARTASGQAAKMNLNPNYTFESFVEGKSNRLAYMASRVVAQTPGVSYNPLFIWGGVGLGKTHLMHAICHYALEHNPSLKILYLTTETFLNEFIQALGAKRLPQFKERFRSMDILLMDDIQFLGGKEQSQEEFYHTFNTLRDGQKQVVLCSDRPPEELRKINIEERLTTRFAGGVPVDIQPPDLETRIAILKRKAELKNCALPNDVAHFLALHIPSNIRELEGALNRAIASSELLNEPITTDRVAEWLKDILRMDLKNPVTIEKIQDAVTEFYGISADDLTGPKRIAELARARQVAMFLCRELTEASLQQIAHAFRKKDHTTVIHAQRKIEELVKEDPILRQTVENLKNKL